MNYPHIAQLLFNRPLMVSEERLQIVLNALTPYLEGHKPPKPTLNDDSIEREEEVQVAELLQDETVVLIPIVGTLVNRPMAMDALSGGPTAYSTIRQHFIRAIADPSVKGIILDFDTAGGDAAGCLDLADFMYHATKEKPVLALVDEMALSAGYALASAATEIVVPRTGNVGSVGVLAVHMDQSEFNKKEGFKYTFVQAGDFKSEGNSHEPLSSSARQHMQEAVNLINGLFVKGVAERRGTTAEAVQALQAGVLFGEEAVQRGLADRISTRVDAIDYFLGRVTHEVFVAVGALDARQVKESAMSKEVIKPQADGSQENDKTEKGTQAAGVIPTNAEVLNGSPGPIEAVSNIEASVQDQVAKYQAYCTEVIQACTLAGKPGAAADFIAKNIPVAQVQKTLIDLRAQESEAEEISNAHATTEGQSASSTKIESVTDVYARFNQEMGVRA